jgi:hypothetical protein
MAQTLLEQALTARLNAEMAQSLNLHVQLLAAQAQVKELEAKVQNEKVPGRIPPEPVA